MRVVVERFLDANGPATISDFARWFGVDPKTGRELTTPVSRITYQWRSRDIRRG